MREMRDVFERFSDAARRTVVLAQEEARMLGDPFIRSQHLLLGLAVTAEPAATALNRSGFDAGSARRELTARQQDQPPVSGHIPFTRNAKRILEHSVTQADQDRRRTIGTADLTLSLVDVKGCTGRQILNRQGVNVSEPRGSLLDIAAHETAVEHAQGWNVSGRQGLFVARGGREVPTDVVDALHRYGRHLDGCATDPCICGL